MIAVQSEFGSDRKMVTPLVFSQAENSTVPLQMEAAAILASPCLHSSIASSLNTHTPNLDRKKIQYYSQLAQELGSLREQLWRIPCKKIPIT